MVEKPKILYLSPEVVPFAKTGGLADVAGALPAAIKRLGADIRLILPFYRIVREGNFKTRRILTGMGVPLGEKMLKANVLETRTDDGVPVYLIEQAELFDRQNLYGNATGDYSDNLERFSFYAHAALRMTEKLSFMPDLIHCNDWQTGLIPALLKGPYKGISAISGTPVVFTIHNLGYQGIFPAKKFIVTGLPREEFFHPEGMEFWGKISLLKAGIVYSDAITTVSPTYARQILTSEYGMGMEGILQHRKASLHGILNGVDYRIWDPARNTNITANYSPQEKSGKGRCKEALIRQMGLDLSLVKKPILGMISRLDNQKGFDLLVETLDDILALDVGLVILGSGDERIQEAIREAAESHPGHVGLKIGFDEPLAHRIIAGADIFMIPSRYEPCGLTQMYALKFGTIPLVRATGGLDDTVVPFDPRTKEGNGFKFGPYKADAFLKAIQYAIDLFKAPEIWKSLVSNAMKEDFSWDKSAHAYLELYRSVM